MKTLELNQMEIIHGGDCYKTTTKVLVTLASTVIAAATGNIFFVVWGLYSLADTMTGGCEEF